MGNIIFKLNFRSMLLPTNPFSKCKVEHFNEMQKDQATYPNIDTLTKFKTWHTTYIRYDNVQFPGGQIYRFENSWISKFITSDKKMKKSN